MLSLLFHFLDEFLFLFSADPFFIPRVSDSLKLLLLLLFYSILKLLNLIRITLLSKQRVMVKHLISVSILKEQRSRQLLTLTCKFITQLINTNVTSLLIFESNHVVTCGAH